MFSRSFLAGFLFALFSWVSTHPARSQTATDPNEGARLFPNPSTPGAYTFSWWGRAGRTYFLQQSDDLNTWTDLPIIEDGADQIISWGLTSSTPKLFLRLDPVDLPTGPPASPGNPTVAWGSDGLHLDWTEPAGGDLLTYRLESSNDNGTTWSEVATFSGGRTSYIAYPDLYTRTLFRLVANNGVGASAPAVFGPAPGRSPFLQAFLDWTAVRFSAAELADLHISGAWADADNDGLPNFEEFMAGSDPHNPDTDGDNVPDGQDAVPTDPDFTIPRVPIARYTLVNLGKDFTPTALNNAGQVLGSGPDEDGNADATPFLWVEGQFYPVPLYQPELSEGTTLDAAYYYPAGIADDGTVIVNDDFRITDVSGYDDSYGAAQRARFDGTSFNAPQFLPSFASYGNRGADVGAAAISKGGKILGSCFRDSTEQGGGDFITRITACVWLPPDYDAPQRAPNLPDGNDRTLTFTTPYAITLYNSTGWDDRLEGAYAITDAGLVLTQTLENNSDDDAYAVRHPGYGTAGAYYHGLLGPAPTQTPVDLGVEAQPRGVNDLLQLAVGHRDQNGIWETLAWIGKKGWQVKPLPMSNALSTDGYSPSKINDAGQILTGGATLWQNGRIYDVNDQIGDPFEPAEPTAGTYVITGLIDLNDAGVMVGVADFQARDAQGNPDGTVEQRAVLLKPVRDADPTGSATSGPASGSSAVSASGANAAGIKPPNPTPDVITVNTKKVHVSFTDYEIPDGDRIVVTLDNANRHPDGTPVVIYNDFIPPLPPRNMVDPATIGDFRYASGVDVLLTHGLNTFTVKATSTGTEGPCTLRILIPRQQLLNGGYDKIVKVPLLNNGIYQFTLGFSQVHFKTQWPESNQHAREAQSAINTATGNVFYPRLMTIQRDEAAANNRRYLSVRSASGYIKRNYQNLDGSSYGPTTGLQDYDEYPLATYPENGGVAHVKPIDRSDNRGSGSNIRSQNDLYDIGDVVELVVD